MNPAKTFSQLNPGTKFRGYKQALPNASVLRTGETTANEETFKLIMKPLLPYFLALGAVTLPAYLYAQSQVSIVTEDTFVILKIEDPSNTAQSLTISDDVSGSLIISDSLGSVSSTTPTTVTQVNGSTVSVSSAELANLDFIDFDHNGGVDSITWSLSNIAALGIDIRTSGDDLTLSGTLPTVDPADLTFTADELAINATITTDSNTDRTITIRPLAANRPIELGNGAVNPSVLQIDTSEIGNLNTSVLLVGSSSAGDITLTSDLTNNLPGNFFLESGGSLINTGDFVIGGPSLALSFAGPIASASNPLITGIVPSLSAAVNGSGGIYVRDNTELIVFQAETNDGDIEFASESGLTLHTVIAGGNGNVTILDEESGGVLIDSITAEGNTITVTSVEAKIEEFGIGDSDADLSATNIILSAAEGIFGTSGTEPLEIEATGTADGEGLNASVTESGSRINLYSDEALRIESATTNNGQIDIESDSTITFETIDSGTANANLTPRNAFFFEPNSNVTAGNGFESVGLDVPVFSLTSSPSTSDQLTVTGTVTIESILFVVETDPDDLPVAGTVYTLIENDGVDPVSSFLFPPPPFAGGELSIGSGGRKLQISYTGGDGNDVTVTAIDTTPPEVVSITLATQGPTTDTSPTFTVIFDEPVQNFTSADLSFDATRLIPPFSYTINGSGDTWTVTPNLTPLSSLNFQLRVQEGGTLTDLAGNGLDFGLGSDFRSEYVAIEFTASDYSTYILAAGATAGVNDGLEQDFNSNGITNGIEYLFNISSVSSPSSFDGRLSTLLDDLGAGDSAFGYVFPLPDSAGTGLLSNPAEFDFFVPLSRNIFVTVKGSSEPGGTTDLPLETFTLTTDEINALPPLDSGWSYVGVRFQDSVSTQDKGFIQIEISYQEPQGAVLE